MSLEDSAIQVKYTMNYPKLNLQTQTRINQHTLINEVPEGLINERGTVTEQRNNTAGSSLLPEEAQSRQNIRINSIHHYFWGSLTVEHLIPFVVLA